MPSRTSVAAEPHHEEHHAANDDIDAPEALLTPSEVAALFRVNPKTVTRWARSGKLTAIRTLGGHRRFKASEIRRCLEEMSHEPELRLALPGAQLTSSSDGARSAAGVRLAFSVAAPTRGTVAAGPGRARPTATRSVTSMATPTAAFSIRLRVRLDNRPGTLGRLATAIGEAGGNITAIGGFDVRGSAPRRGRHRQLLLGGRTSTRSSRRCAPSTASSWSRCRTAPSRCTTAARSRCCRGCRSPIATTSRWPTRRAWPGCARRSRSSPALVHELTIKKNTVAIVTDGTAVLGLGDIGPAGALPVMEGKALLFKEFGGVDGFPICLDVVVVRGDHRDGGAHRARVRRHQPRGHRRARRASRSRTGSRSCSTSRCSTTTSTAPPWWRWPRSRTRCASSTSR